MTPKEFWRLTLVELSLYLEGYANRVQYEDERAMSAAWLMSKLSRAKRIPSLFRLLKFKDKPLALPPEEAEREKARHQALVDRLAPGAITDPEKIREFVRQQEKEMAASKK